ncbi:hypothetical protein OG500_37205 [Kitasatospora sp. NBC_01250]|uniref:hypothetical protein n=1 Tax=Kitasatospora sp. NBC_01250 TaxID=2903571 RepID=UPI002E34FE00|nr:hypothetical protein [Kitasatospora sp. NBC_01250]
MHMLAVLTEFGALGGIAGIHPLGSFPDVTDRLGPPGKSGRISDDQPWPQWFSYGDVVVETCACHVITKVSIRTWYDTIRIPDAHSGEIRTIAPATTFRELRAAFSEAGLPWRLLPQEHSLPQFTVETEPAGLAGVSVHFTFTTDETPDQLDAPLHSAFAVESVHLCP